MTDLTLILLLGAAVWLLSTTLSRARILEPLRAIVKRRSDYWGEGISCQYCISHWVGAALVLMQRPLDAFAGTVRPVQYLLTWAAIVGAANLMARTAGRADVKTQAEVPTTKIVKFWGKIAA